MTPLWQKLVDPVVRGMHRMYRRRKNGSHQYNSAWSFCRCDVTPVDAVVMYYRLTVVIPRTRYLYKYIKSNCICTFFFFLNQLHICIFIKNKFKLHMYCYKTIKLRSLFPTVQRGAPEAGGGPGGRHHQVGVTAHQGGC